MRVRAGAATGPEASDGAVDRNDVDMRLHGRTPAPSDAAALASITPAGLVVDGALRLVVARDEWRRQHPADAARRLAVACAPSAHSSVRAAAGLLDLDVVAVPGEARDRLTADALRAAVHDRPVCAAVASAGATNTGLVDELDAVADVCAATGRGCTSMRPTAAARTHRQSAPYLDAFGAAHVNPSDLAFHLTRRARGLPFWFALVVHGTDAFTATVRAAVELASRAADLVAAMGEPVRLVMEPELSVVLFERDGWSRADWDAWAAAALADGLAFLHPDTDLTTVTALLARLR